MEVAKSLGKDVLSINEDCRISGTTFIELEEQDTIIVQKGLYPKPQPTRKLHTEIRQKMVRAMLGKNIAPKTIKRNKVSSSGQLKETEIAVHGRKIPLDYI